MRVYVLNKANYNKHKVKMINIDSKIKGGILVSEHNQNPSNFNAQFHEQEIHRGKRYGKKKRSWVSIIIHLIILILTAITGYSMLKQPIFNLAFANKTINFHEIQNFQDTLTKIGNLNINLGNMDDLQKSIDNLIMVFNIFFILLFS